MSPDIQVWRVLSWYNSPKKSYGVTNNLILDLDFLVLNDLTHYSNFVLEEETVHWYPAFLSGWVRYPIMEFLTIKRSDSILVIVIRPSVGSTS